MSFSRRTPRWLAPLVRIGVALGLLALLLTRLDFSEGNIQWDRRVALGAALAFAMLLLAQICSTLRWRLVLGSSAPSLGELLHIYFIGTFFSLFLPTSIGGDAVRAVGVSRLTGEPSAAASSVVLDRLLGAIAMFGLLFIGILTVPSVSSELLAKVAWTPSIAQLAIGGAILAIGAATIWVLRARLGVVRSALARAGRLWADFWTRPAMLAGGFGWGLAVQLSYLVAWYVLAWSLRLPVPALEFLVYVPFVSLAAMLPVTISGLGVREGVWTLILAGHGVVAVDAVAFSLLYFILFALIGAVGGLALLLRGISPVVHAQAPRERSAEPAQFVAS